MIDDYFNKHSCYPVINPELYQELEEAKYELSNMTAENNKLNKQFDKLYIEYNELKRIADKLANTVKVMSYKNILK
tara:strand:+ start:7447 stop:7674 length:228 start_codon:yes stop_codon:yes gene_type:complete